MEKRTLNICLEDIEGTFDSDKDIFLASIAVSLKRIADVIAGTGVENSDLVSQLGLMLSDVSHDHAQRMRS